MRNCHRTSCLHLFFKQRNNASITSQHIPESYDHVFCSGIFAEGLYDHFTHTFRCTHDIGRVYCFIRRDQYKFLYPVLVRSSCCLISTKHIVFNGFIRTVFHKWHVFMGCRMKNNIRSIMLHDAFNSTCISNRTYQYFQLQIWILTNQLLLNVIGIVLIDIKNDKKLWIVGSDLTA